MAYRVGAGDASVVFSGDVSAYHPLLAALARRNGLLVHDMALPETRRAARTPTRRAVGCRPARRRRECGALLLTHVMPALEPEQTQADRLVVDAYCG